MHLENTPRFYFSSAGYICDSKEYTKLARLQDKNGWREYGQVLCEELNARPDNAIEIIKAYKAHLE